jgi:DNA polymerase-3 subunit beta
MLLKPESITMVATDGHRLAHCERAGEKFEGVSGELKTLVPKKAMDELKSLLDSTDAETIEFAKDDSTLYFRIGSRLLTSRQLTGQFPNFEAVLPKDNSKIVPLNSDELNSVCAWKKVNSSFPRLRPKPASPKIRSKRPTRATR